MLLEKLARAIACKHCENPSKLYELQINADEQTREILRLNHVLDEVKKERDAARAVGEGMFRRSNSDNIQLRNVLKEIEKKSCFTCGKKCRVRPKDELLMRYNCHLWVPMEVEHEDHA